MNQIAIREVYQIIQTGVGSWAVIDTVRQQQTNEIQIIASGGLNKLVGLQDIADALNGRIHEAVKEGIELGKVASEPSKVQLKDSTLRMINGIVEGTLSTTRQRMEKSGLVDHLRNMVRNDEAFERAQAEAWEKVRADVHSSMEPSKFIDELVRKAYAKAIEQGVVEL